MRTDQRRFEIVVCGGGLAGFCAAVAAARQGATVCLVQNRPVLGGNCSSEIGVTPHGSAAFHAYARETGIISEALIEERARNHAEVYENGWTNSVWDMVLYDIALREPTLELFLNTDVEGVEMDPAGGQLDSSLAAEPTLELGYYHRPSRIRNGPGRIAAITARVQNAERLLRIEGGIFIDCTGDGLVADRAGCEWRMGAEGREETGEPHAPDAPSTDTMGNSIHFLARDMGQPVPYNAPAWAVHHEDASYFYDQGRIPKDARGGFWWIEIGVPYHTIHDNETIRHELTRHALGVWDWMKNRDPIMRERTRNFALDWIGQVPGKRESRRIMGLRLMDEHDALEKRVFEDEIAFGGWFVDLHTPGGLLAPTSEPTAADGNHSPFSDYSAQSYCGPYGIPLSSLIAKDVENLMMAGRNISVTRAALGTTRVMGTTALLGEAAGIAAALSLRSRKKLADMVSGESVKAIQQTLLRGGCFLPNSRNEDPGDLARKAKVHASSEALVHGSGPDSKGFHPGLAVWRDQPQFNDEALSVAKAQSFFWSGGVIDWVELCLDNVSDRTEELPVALHAQDHIWDYRLEPGRPLASGTLAVPPGRGRWVRWYLGIDPASHGVQPGGLLRLGVPAKGNLSWRIAGSMIPGHLASYQIAPSKMRRFGNGETLSYRIHPAQKPFGATNVLSGVTRPHRNSNLWMSDPTQPLDQFIELSWAAPVSMAEIRLVFPGHLLREYHAYSPFYRDAQCPRDYTLLAEDPQGTLVEITQVTGNFQRVNHHRLETPVSTQRLRMVIHATNGDPAAQIYEIRVYPPGYLG